MMKPTLLPNEQMRHINDAEDADAAEGRKKDALRSYNE